MRVIFYFTSSEPLSACEVLIYSNDVSALIVFTKKTLFSAPGGSSTSRIMTLPAYEALVALGNGTQSLSEPRRVDRVGRACYRITSSECVFDVHAIASRGCLVADSASPQ